MKTTRLNRNSKPLTAFLAVALSAALQSTGLAGPAVQGTGDVRHAVPNPAGPPPIAAGAPVEGASATIHRTHSGVTVNIHTVGLNPHHAYTVWLVEVNCGAPVCIPTFLAGHIVGASGEGHFTGRKGLNPDPSLPVQDPFGGEFHAIIADHGPMDPSILPEDIKTGVPPFGPDGSLNWTQLIIFEP